jgi:hypothetical protein
VSLAVAGAPGAARVLAGPDGRQQLLAVDTLNAAAAPRALPLPASATAAAAGAGGLLAAREGSVLLLDANRALWLLPAAGDGARALPVRGAAQWRRPVAIAVYAGNLYVLDGGGDGAPGQIWRHAGNPNAPDAGFDGEAQAWLQPASGVRLDDATGFCIDGAIWVSRQAGQADGTIMRLAGGRREAFAPQGVEPPITAAGAIFTQSDARGLYVVDSALRRVVQLAKDGRFERQALHAFAAGEQPRGLWVDELAGRALVLTDRRLQEVRFE